MKNYKFEYIWLDGYQPEPSLRSKTKVLAMKSFKGDIKKLPLWNYDGSSTQQAEGHSSDCVLKPCSIYRDPERKNAWLVMCEVVDSEGKPHSTNTRALIKNDSKHFWFGFEQEYVIMLNAKPIGFPEKGEPGPQGPYYCGVGHDQVAGRDIVEDHLDICLKAGLKITGINAEVMLGQWEYQCFAKGGKQASDDLWVSRYLLYRLAEYYGVKMDLSPKPLKGDWNGSGCHTNFSNKRMRKRGGKRYFHKIFHVFEKNHKKHIAVYGSKNEERLTGKHETQSIDAFSVGASDRGASIRIPLGTAETWVGYLEDRRPASNIDPYKVVAVIMDSVKEAEELKSFPIKKKKKKIKKITVIESSPEKVLIQKVKIKKTAAKKAAPKKVVAKKTTTKKATKPRAKKVYDLKIIEGIGPKIESLLKAAGVDTFGKLSRASFTKLRKILDNAGSRYRMHDPTTWPEQAKLANGNKMDELNALKDKLKGGRVK